MRADVAVIGGGLVGCSAAWFMAKAGLKVILLEERQVGYGASGRNPGFLWIQGRPAGIPLDLARFGLSLYPTFLAELEGDFEYRQNGGLIYFYTDAQRAVLAEHVRRRNADGVPMELVDGQTARELAPILPADVLGAAYCPEDAQIRTPKLVACLADGIRRLGGQVLEERPATGFRLRSGRVEAVETPAGPVEADLFCVTAGVWSRRIAEQAGLVLPVQPERLQVVEVGPLPPLVDRLLYGPLACKQYEMIRQIPGYREEDFAIPAEGRAGVEFLELLCQTKTGHLLLGCPMDYPAELAMDPTLGGLAITSAVLQERFPALRGAPVTRTWAGLLPFTGDGLPVIDRAPGLANLWLGAGHVFGNTGGPATGKLLAEVALGERPSVDLTPFSFARLGVQGEGPIRW
jgi:glycine/D-amino acid oxidase-like deaminating enzyme